MKQYTDSDRGNKDMLNKAINKYNKRAIETSKVIEELIALAKEMNESYKAGGVDGWWDGSLTTIG